MKRSTTGTLAGSLVLGLALLSLQAAPGDLDPAFSPGAGANGEVIAIVLQPDGKFLVGGSFTRINGTNRNHLARLNADGGLDLSFSNSVSSDVYSIVRQTDGKLLIGGDFTTVNGVSCGRIARLNPDGSPDTSFNPAGAGATGGSVYQIAPRSDGKIVIGGTFTKFNGVTRVLIARLTTAGALDNGFVPPSFPFPRAVYSILVDPDGKVVIGGLFGADNVGRNCIARLNRNGSLDDTFNPQGVHAVTGTIICIDSIVRETSGKLLVGGSFTNFNFVTRSNIVRLEPNGTVDNSFSPVIQGNDGDSCVVQAMKLQSDGKIFISGVFTNVNGTARNRIARLNSDGSLDSSFNPGTGANDMVNPLTLQCDGGIVVGGLFTSVNGTSRNRIARLLGDPFSGPTLENPQRLPDGSFQCIVCGEAGHVYQISSSTNLVDWQSAGVVTNAGASWPYVDSGATTNQPMKFYRATE